MASRGAHKRLAREYANITANPPPYITAHPSDSNILEWHCMLTGPPDTPYDGGQYHVTLTFPPTYPFAPPAIRMLTPSGRFQPNTRLCLSISDFHPKQFNPAWEVSTILLGLQSFMTSNEMTTGSISATDAERRHFASRTRWWNSTGGGTCARTISGVDSAPASKFSFGALKSGDGGKLFRDQWPELDEENWKWMEEQRVDTATGKPTAQRSTHVVTDTASQQASSTSGQHTDNLQTPSAQAQARPAAALPAQGLLARYKWYIVASALVAYVLFNRIMGQED